MYERLIITTFQRNHRSSSPDGHQNHHRSTRSSDSLSFRYFYDNNTVENTIPAANYNTPSASPAFLSPESSPLLVAPTSESRWSFLSPPHIPPIRHHHLPPLLHHCGLSLHLHDGNIHSITVAGGLLFTTSRTPYIRTWHLSYNKWCELGCIRASSGDIRAMLGHGNMIFTSHKDLKIRVWRISPTSSHINMSFHLRKLATFPKSKPFQLLLSKSSSQQHKDVISCMAYNLLDGILYTGSFDKTVKAWTLYNRKCVDTFVAHSDDINAMVINDDGCLFSCSSDGTLKMWTKVHGDKVTCHTLTAVLHYRPFPIHTLALARATTTENSFLYSGASDGCIFFWEQQIPGEQYTACHKCIQGHQLGVLCLAVLDDKLISGSTDTTIKIWRRKRECGVVFHECLGVLEGHNGPVKCVVACFEDDCFARGLLLFSAGLDCTFKAWKVKVLPQTKDGSHVFDDGVDDED